MQDNHRSQGRDLASAAIGSRTRRDAHDRLRRGARQDPRHLGLQVTVVAGVAAWLAVVQKPGDGELRVPRQPLLNERLEAVELGSVRLST